MSHMEISKYFKLKDTEVRNIVRETNKIQCRPNFCFLNKKGLGVCVNIKHLFIPSVNWSHNFVDLKWRP